MTMTENDKILRKARKLLTVTHLHPRLTSYRLCALEYSSLYQNIGQDIMMHLQRRVALIFTLAALLQLPLTNASTQECIQQGDGLPTLSMWSFSTSLIAQCPSFANISTTIDCFIDFGDSSFASSCKSAGGVVYDYDYNITCPSSDSDGTRKITANNFFVCASKNCTAHDMKAIFEGRTDVVSVFGDGCSVETYSVVSASAQECRLQSNGLPTLSYSSFLTSLDAQCPSLATDPTSDCVVDFTDSNFASICQYAGGEVYDVNYTQTCPSSDSDGPSIFTANNFFWCAAKICTNDDIKAQFEDSNSGEGCSIETYSVETFSVVSTISASAQECQLQSYELPLLSRASISTSLDAQCPSLATDPTSDCIVDFTDSNFASICQYAGGEVYDVNYTQTCPSSDSDGSQKITANNYFVCAAKICTRDDIKAQFKDGDSGDGCSIETNSVVPAIPTSPQECQRQSQGLPLLSRASISASQNAQCPSWTTDATSDCVVDYTDSSFPTTCTSAGGEVYDVDSTITCPSNDSDGTQKFTANNYFVCAAKICTTDDMKAIFEESNDRDGCSVTLSVASGSTVIRVSTSLIRVLAASSLLFLIDVL